MSYEYVYLNLNDTVYTALELLPFVNESDKGIGMIDQLYRLIDQHITTRTNIPLCSLSKLISQASLEGALTSPGISDRLRMMIESRLSYAREHPLVFIQQREGLPQYRCLHRRYNAHTLKNLITKSYTLAMKNSYKDTDLRVSGYMRKHIISRIKLHHKHNGGDIHESHHIDEEDLIYITYQGMNMSLIAPTF
jgi:hypothetical protein